MKRCLKPECKSCIWRVDTECVHPDCRHSESIEDCLIVAYDCCSSDTPTLSVVRKEGDKVRVVNTIQGDEAFGMYCYLTGNATLVRRTTKRKKKRKYYRRCGVCGERYEQSEMLRTDDSPNGWVCWDCRNLVNPEYDD